MTEKANKVPGEVFEQYMTFMRLKYGRHVKWEPLPINPEVMVPKYGAEKEYVKCPIDSPAAKIMWGLMHLYRWGAPYGEIEKVALIFCDLYEAPAKETMQFIFGEDSPDGELEAVN